ncbi:MAG TPA: HAD family phosphatase [Clostridiales bacterium]|nr:HAD family phosphatase [Clostridiales bacterium]
MFQLIASDFDGTIYHHGRIAQEDRDAVAAWRAAGRHFGIVTGRGITFPPMMQELDVDCDFYLCCNGAVLMDADGNILRENQISAEVFERLEQAFRDKPGAYNYSITAQQTAFHQYNGQMPTQQDAIDFVAELNARFGEDITAYANGININIVARGESKALGVVHALEHFSLPEQAAAVVGDELNDLPMIEHFNGWAMANARPEVLAATSRMCRSIADLIEQLFAHN